MIFYQGLLEVVLNTGLKKIINSYITVKSLNNLIVNGLSILIHLCSCNKFLKVVLVICQDIHNYH